MKIQNQIAKGGPTPSSAIFDMYNAGIINYGQMVSMMKMAGQPQPVEAPLPTIPFCEKAWRAMEPDQAIRLWYGFKEYMVTRQGGIDKQWHMRNGPTELNVAAVANYVISLVHAKNGYTSGP